MIINCRIVNYMDVCQKCVLSYNYGRNKLINLVWKNAYSISTCVAS